MKMKKWIGYLSFGVILVLTLSFFNPIRAAISQIAGLAVAESTTKWNNVKDASVGDNLTNGVLVSGLYEFDGTNWDRVQGDTTNGIDVDVTRFPGTAADNSTNSTGKLPVLAGRANAAAPSWTEGYQVPLSTDLTGSLRITGAVTIPVSGTGFYAVKRVDIAAVSVNIPFGFTSKKVVIETAAANTDEIVIDWIGGTAVVPAANTAGDDRVGPGRTITLDNYAVASISVIAVSGTQTISIRAWN